VKQASPFAQRPKAVPKVRDGVNAQHGIEAASFIGQRPAAIANGECRPLSEPARGGLGLGMGNPSILEI